MKAKAFGAGIAVGVIAVVVLLACQKQEPAPVAPAAPPAAAVPLTAAAPMQAAAPVQDLKADPEAGELRWNAVAPLVRRAPKSNMRAAEYGIEGDTQAELSVFYFGPGQGGAVDANISRWLGQLTQADGSDTTTKSKRSELKVGDIAVTMIEAKGAYSGGMAMPGMPSQGPIPDAMLLGAIAIGPQGPVFFKLVGPTAAVERARVAFKTLVESLHKH